VYWAWVPPRGPLTVVEDSTWSKWSKASSGCNRDRNVNTTSAVVGRGRRMGCGRFEKRVEGGNTGLSVLITNDDLSAKLSEIMVSTRWDLRIGHAHPDGVRYKVDHFKFAWPRPCFLRPKYLYGNQLSIRMIGRSLGRSSRRRWLWVREREREINASGRVRVGLDLGFW
jgi:hypothetical protein